MTIYDIERKMKISRRTALTERTYVKAFFLFASEKQREGITEKIATDVLGDIGIELAKEMLENLYILRIKNIGAFHVGEEARFRRFVREIYVDEETGKHRFRLVPNKGMKKTFRLHWDKAGCKSDHVDVYIQRTQLYTKKLMGRHIGERETDPYKPNFRSYVIVN